VDVPFMTSGRTVDVDGEGLQVTQVVGNPVREEGLRSFEQPARGGELGLVTLGQRSPGQGCLRHCFLRWKYEFRTRASIQEPGPVCTIQEWKCGRYSFPQ